MQENQGQTNVQRSTAQMFIIVVANLVMDANAMDVREGAVGVGELVGIQKLILVNASDAAPLPQLLFCGLEEKMRSFRVEEGA